MLMDWFQNSEDLTLDDITTTMEWVLLGPGQQFLMRPGYSFIRLDLTFTTTFSCWSNELSYEAWGLLAQCNQQRLLDLPMHKLLDLKNDVYRLIHYFESLCLVYLDDMLSFLLIDVPFDKKTSKHLKSFQPFMNTDEMDQHLKSLENLQDSKELKRYLVSVLLRVLPETIVEKGENQINSYFDWLDSSGSFIIGVGNVKEVYPAKYQQHECALFTKRDCTTFVHLPYDSVEYDPQFLWPGSIVSIRKDGDSVDMVMLGIVKYINHSTRSNCIITKNGNEVKVLKIKKGTQVLLNYGNRKYFAPGKEWKPNEAPLFQVLDLDIFHSFVFQPHHRKQYSNWGTVLKAAYAIQNAKEILFLTGAGISSHCMPVFRNGKSRKTLTYPKNSNEQVQVYQTWIELYRSAIRGRPGLFHKFMETCFNLGKKNGFIYTQNIDGFESRLNFGDRVSFLHGKCEVSHCSTCNTTFQVTPDLIEKMMRSIESGENVAQPCSSCSTRTRMEGYDFREASSVGVLEPGYLLYDDSRDSSSILPSATYTFCLSRSTKAGFVLCGRNQFKFYGSRGNQT